MDATQDSAWTAHPQRIDPSSTGALSPPITILYDGLHVSGTSAVESVSNIRSFIHSSSRITAVRNLRGRDAQGFIDLIDQVSSLWPQRDGFIRGLSARCRSSRCQSWMGSFGGNVCICFTKYAKPVNYCRHRMFWDESLYVSVTFTVAAGSRTSAKESTWGAASLSNTSGSGQGTRSTKFSRCLSCEQPNSLPLLSSSIEVLPGDYRLEVPVPPQHLAFVRSLHFHRSTEFLDRL